jgi:hypothetical protein
MHVWVRLTLQLPLAKHRARIGDTKGGCCLVPNKHFQAVSHRGSAEKLVESQQLHEGSKLLHFICMDWSNAAWALVTSRLGKGRWLTLLSLLELATIHQSGKLQ